MEKIRVLVVDDSIFMRTTIKKIITNDDIEVIETAANGKDAIEKTLELQPDIITMDVEMPVMNGIEALRNIMIKSPTPVLMLSTLTSEGADATMEALSLGAIDFVTKKAAFNDMYGLKEELIAKITEIGRNRLLQIQFRRKRSMAEVKNKIKDDKDSKDIALHLSKKSKTQVKEKLPKAPDRRPKSADIEIIGIGISTGGPVALQSMIPKLPENLPVAILIAQHMPPKFTKSLADRLNLSAKINVKEAEDNEFIKPGYIYIAPGGKQMIVSKKRKIIITDEPADELYKPSVNVMMNSIAEVYGKRALGVIMTGMGHDGQIGLQNLHDKGGWVIAQDINTCVVAGMPKSVIDSDIANEIIPLDNLASVISSIFRLKAV